MGGQYISHSLTPSWGRSIESRLTGAWKHWHRQSGGFGAFRTETPSPRCGGVSGRSVFCPPLMRAGNFHVLAILGHCPSRDLNALRLQNLGDLLIGVVARRIFFFDQLLHPPFEDQQRTSGAFRPLDTFRKEKAQLVYALRRMHVFAGNSPAYGRGMHTDLFGHFLDHHRLEEIDAAVQELALTPNDRVADLQNCLPALFDVLDQLHSRLVTFFHIGADFFLDSFRAMQQTTIGGAHPELWE